MFASQNDYPQANAVLDEVERILKQSPDTNAESTAAPEGNFADLFKARLTALISQIKQAAGTPASDEAKRKASEAAAFARNHDFTEANLLIDQAEAALTPNSESKGLLSAEFAQRWKRATEDWRDAVDTINRQLENLRSKLLMINEIDYPELIALIPQLKEIGETGLSYVLDGQRVALQVAIQNIDQANDDEKAKFITPAHELVKKIRDYISTDEKIEVCEDNGLDIEVSISEQLGGVLAGLDETLHIALVS